MLLKTFQCFLIFAFLDVFGNLFALGYRKYYVEDECTSPDDFQKIVFRLPATGPESVGEVRPNRFGTYSRMGRNCLVKLVPPKGYGVIVTVLRVDFRNHEGCKDFIKIYAEDDENEGDRLCGFQETELKGKSFYSENELKIMYHTSKGGLGFSNGFRLIFTVTKLDTTHCSGPDEFQCANSRCVWAGVRCDGINNCGDNSDELSMNNSHCTDMTPIAITAVVLGITSFVAILVVMCVCCCRSQPDILLKPPLMKLPLRPNAGYTPLPGYSPLPGVTYADSTQHMQPVHSSVRASAPPYYTDAYGTPVDPRFLYEQQKIGIRYDRPPPYNA